MQLTPRDTDSLLQLLSKEGLFHVSLYAKTLFTFPVQAGKSPLKELPRDDCRPEASRIPSTVRA